MQCRRQLLTKASLRRIHQTQRHVCCCTTGVDEKQARVVITAWLDNTACLGDVEVCEWGKGRLRIGESVTSGPGKWRARSSLMEMASPANYLTTHCHRHTTPPDLKSFALALTASLSKPLAITAHTPIDRNTSARAFRYRQNGAL